MHYYAELCGIMRENYAELCIIMHLVVAMQLHWNILGWTVVVQLIPADLRAGKRRRSLDGLNN